MSEKLHAEWFWCGQWFASSAMLLPLEAKGLYREMLTRAWSLGGKLPSEAKSIQKLVMVSSEEWARTWPLVRRFWKTTPDGAWIYNETQQDVMKVSTSISEKRAAAGRKGGKASAEARRKAKQSQANGQANGQANEKQKRSISLSLPLSLPDDAQRPNDRNDSCSPRASDGRNPLYTPAFENFWGAYPRKVGKGKAARAWKTRKAHEHLEAILLHIQADIASEQWQDASLIPHPTTWLNQERWDDPLTPAGVGRSSHGEGPQMTEDAARNAARIREATGF